MNVPITGELALVVYRIHFMSAEESVTVGQIQTNTVAIERKNYYCNYLQTKSIHFLLIENLSIFVREETLKIAFPQIVISSTVQNSDISPHGIINRPAGLCKYISSKSFLCESMLALANGCFS